MTDTPVDQYQHPEKRPNIPTSELETFLRPEDREPIRAAYERRNPDLDPQLVWRGKDLADRAELAVEAPPIYLQEQVHPKALIEDLRAGRARAAARPRPLRPFRPRPTRTARPRSSSTATPASGRTG